MIIFLLQLLLLASLSVFIFLIISNKLINIIFYNNNSKFNNYSYLKFFIGNYLFIISSIFFIFFPNHCQALNFSERNIKTFIESKSVYCIAFDRNGCLWVGTNDGLWYTNNKIWNNPRINEKFKQYKKNISDDETILSFIYYKNKELWCLSEKYGLYYHKPKYWLKLSTENDIERNETNLADYRLNEGLIIKDSNNRIWIKSSTTLSYFSSDENNIIHTKIKNISSIIELKKDHYLAIENNGTKLYSFNIDANNKIEKKIVESGLTNTLKMTMIDNNLVIIASSDILYKYDITNRKLTHYATYDQKEDIFNLYTDKSYNIWLSSKDDITIISKNKEIKTYSKKSGLPEGGYNSLLQDDYKNYWICSDNGLAQIDITPPLIENNNKLLNNNSIKYKNVFIKFQKGLKENNFRLILNDEKSAISEANSLELYITDGKYGTPIQDIIIKYHFKSDSEWILLEDNLIEINTDILENKKEKILLLEASDSSGNVKSISVQIKDLNENKIVPDELKIEKQIKYICTLNKDNRPEIKEEIIDKEVSDSGNICFVLKANPEKSNLPIVYSVLDPVKKEWSDFSEKSEFKFENLKNNSYIFRFKAKYKESTECIEIPPKKININRSYDECKIYFDKTFPCNKLVDKGFIKLSTNSQCNNSFFGYKLDNLTWTPFQNNQLQLPAMFKEGKHEINIAIKKKGGEVNPHIYKYEFNYIRTSDKPVIFELSPPTFTNNEVCFNFKGRVNKKNKNIINNSSLLYSYRLIPYKFNWCNAAQTTTAVFPNLPDGKYLFQVKVMDIEANESLPEEYDFHFTNNNPWYKSSKILLVIFFTVIIGFISFYRKRFFSNQKIIDISDNFSIQNTTHHLDELINKIFEMLKENNIYLIGRIGDGKTFLLEKIKEKSIARNYNPILISYTKEDKIEDIKNKITEQKNEFKNKKDFLICIDNYDKIKRHLYPDNLIEQNLVSEIRTFFNDNGNCEIKFIVTACSSVNESLNFQEFIISPFSDRVSKEMIMQKLKYNCNETIINKIITKVGNNKRLIGEVFDYIVPEIKDTAIDKACSEVLYSQRKTIKDIINNQDVKLQQLIYECIKNGKAKCSFQRCKSFIDSKNNHYFYFENNYLCTNLNIPFNKKCLENIEKKIFSIFVSYNRDDKECVSQIVERIKDSNYDVKWDKDFRGGAIWKDLIDGYIKECDAFIICVGDKGFGEYQEKQEFKIIEKFYTDNIQKVIPCSFGSSTEIIERNFKILNQHSFFKQFNCIKLKEFQKDISKIIKSLEEAID